MAVRGEKIEREKESERKGCRKTNIPIESKTG